MKISDVNMYSGEEIRVRSKAYVPHDRSMVLFVCSLGSFSYNRLNWRGYGRKKFSPTFVCVCKLLVSIYGFVFNGN